MKIWILTLLVGSVLAAPSFEVHHIQTRNIASLLQDIIEETGIKDLLPWVQEMMRTDPDVQRFVEYLNSGKFEAIIDHFKNCPGYAEVKDKLAAEGVDLVDMLEKIRNFITGHDDVYYKIQPRHTLGELLNEFIPPWVQDRINEVFKDKFKNDPDMKKVIEFVKGDTMKGIVECMETSPEVMELVQKLNDEGIDVAAIIELIKTLLAEHTYYHVSSRTVGTLLKDLIDELGFRGLIPWIKEMIETDPDVQRIIDYLRGPVFQNIENHLRNCPGYPEVRDKLKDEGVDLVEILQHIRDFFTGGSRHYYKIQPRGSLADLLKKILDRMDINRVLAVIQDKIKNDPDMTKVIDFVKGDTFKGIVDCMKASKDVQDLIEKLAEEGIDVPSLVEMIKGLLLGGM